jgi:hypothetical protein
MTDLLKEEKDAIINSSSIEELFNYFIISQIHSLDKDLLKNEKRITDLTNELDILSSFSEEELKLKSSEQFLYFKLLQDKCHHFEKIMYDFNLSKSNDEFTTKQLEYVKSRMINFINYGVDFFFDVITEENFLNEFDFKKDHLKRCIDSENKTMQMSFKKKEALLCFLKENSNNEF